MARVHDLLRAAKAPEPWAAAFVSTLCIAWPDGTDEVFEGRVAGRLTWPPRGEAGFGFDPMFLPDGQHDRPEKTFAQMPPEAKARFSHRAAAFVAFRAALLD